MVVRLAREARPWWGHVLALLGVSALAAPLLLLMPVPVQIGIDHVVGARPLPAWLSALVPDAWEGSPTALLLAAAVLQVVLGALVHGQAVAQWTYSAWVANRMVLDFRLRLFRHAQRLSLAYHDRRGAADSAFRILHDAPAVRYVLVDSPGPLVTSTVTRLGMAIVTARLSPQLALVGLAVAPVVVVVTILHGRKLRGEWHAIKDLDSRSLSVVQETLS